LHSRVFAGMENDCLVSLVTVMCEEILLCYGYTKTEVFCSVSSKYEGWNFNSGNYLFTTDTK